MHSGSWEEREHNHLWGHGRPVGSLWRQRRYWLTANQWPQPYNHSPTGASNLSELERKFRWRWGFISAHHLPFQPSVLEQRIQVNQPQISDLQAWKAFYDLVLQEIKYVCLCSNRKWIQYSLLNKYILKISEEEKIDITQCFTTKRKRCSWFWQICF